MSSDSLSRRAALARIGSFAALAALPWPSIAQSPKPKAESGSFDFEHPDPRPGITAAAVLSDDKLGDKKSVREAFAAARAYPEIFDGLYCACECSKSMNHRSLLSCFESSQPVGCHGCREQAMFVERLAKQGKTLDVIRQAVDKKFG